VVSNPPCLPVFLTERGLKIVGGKENQRDPQRLNPFDKLIALNGLASHPITEYVADLTGNEPL
jgi:hypothetical protein